MCVLEIILVISSAADEFFLSRTIVIKYTQGQRAQNVLLNISE